jgi:hypothetical protein
MDDRIQDVGGQAQILVDGRTVRFASTDGTPTPVLIAALKQLIDNASHTAAQEPAAAG